MADDDTRPVGEQLEDLEGYLRVIEDELAALNLHEDDERWKGDPNWHCEAIRTLRSTAVENSCDLSVANIQIAELKEQLQAATTGAGVFHHDVWCNADRRKPMGAPMCSCEAWRRISKIENGRLATEILNATLESVLVCARDALTVLAHHAPGDAMLGDISMRAYAEQQGELLRAAQFSVVEDRAALINELVQTSRELGPWMSAMLSDGECDLYRTAAENFLEAVVGLETTGLTGEETP